MNDETRRRYSLNISKQTKDLLSSIKHTGQSYDGLIQDLVKYWKERKRMEGKSGDQAREEAPLKMEKTCDNRSLQGCLDNEFI